MTELAQNLIDALALGSLYALIALGVTVIYTVMGMMNFAHGEFIMLAAYALYVLAGLPFAAALGGALVTGVVIAIAGRAGRLPAGSQRRPAPRSSSPRWRWRRSCRTSSPRR